ncbi:MAG: bifunctional glutamate N-acetyltransferase/amino-acid acetyltransferase ArgJ [Acidiferrobacterales bacterium]
MAVNLPPLTELHPVSGIRLGTAMAGIRKRDRRDLVVIECATGTRAAAVFTQNRFCAAPVLVARGHLGAAQPRALVINTGYANAGTGEPGMHDAVACCEELAQRIGVRASEILPFSTGVIGERLPVERIIAGLSSCIATLDERGWADAASGIMTTDTLPKGSSVCGEIGGTVVTVTGIAKGSGMICPNMATMLTFVATDASVGQAALDALVRSAARVSFNRITVDGDTSTNDSCILLATGRAGNPQIERPEGATYQALSELVTRVFTELAQAVIRDAEGATKFITIEVSGGRSEDECLEVAQTIAHSPLVKTAFFASDPNWGRILAAVGRARIGRLDVGSVSIHLNGACIVRGGARAPEYTEAQGRAVMAEAEITLQVDLGAGSATTRLWTSDLSHEYIRINAEYRT